MKSTVAASDNTKRDLRNLKEELDRAKIVAVNEMPSNVITMNSVLIAENAIENIRKKITYNESVEDCTYVETVGRREYTVQRRIIIPDSLLLENKQPSLLDIEINISPGVDNLQNNSPMTFRFLQGTTW